MSTTVDLDDELMRRAKRRSEEEGLTFSELLDRALRMHLERRPAGKTGYKLKLKTYGGGLQPGVSFDDWNALRDRMDRLT
jgi:hypothetical protein